LDNYLTRIIQLLNNNHTNIQGENDLTISFSLMHELNEGEIPLYELVATSQPPEEQMTQLIYDGNTQLIYYNMNDETIDRICPISHENFEDGEIITKIRGCGHIFKTNNIKRWLFTNPCCPTCRFNIITQQYPTNNNIVDEIRRPV
jgi:hypothetical protein